MNTCYKEGGLCLGISKKTPLADKGKRRDHRFEDSIRGSLKYRGSSYLCLVADLSQRGLHLLSGAAVDVGDRLSVDLHISEDTRLSCVIVARHVTSDGLGAEIEYIPDTAANVLSGRIEKHEATLMVADAVRRGLAREID
jgi:hypothetical protein